MKPNIKHVILLGVALGVALLGACAPAPTPVPTLAVQTAAAPPTAAPQPTAVPPTAAPTAVPATKPPEPTKPPAKTGEYRGAFPYQVPPTGHWNSYVTNGIPNGLSIYWDLLEQPLAMYKWGDGSWMPLMATKWEIVPPDKFVVTLRSGVKWSDGKTFSAKDVLTTFAVGRLFNWTVFNYVDTVTAKDDNTVEFKMNKPSSVVVRLVLKEHIRSSATYGDIAAKMDALVKVGKDKASDEWKALLKEATDFRPKELIVTGPYNIDPKSVTEAQLTMLPVPTAWDYDKVNFAKIVLYNGETPVVTPIVLAGDLDYATHGFPPATEKAFMDQKVRIIRAPIYSGPALYFNYDLYPLNRVEVRQAMAYAIKRDENGTVSLGDSGKAVKYMTGISDNLVPLWLSADQIAKLNTYAFDTKKTESLLTGIGFKKGADGVWVDDKGKPLAFELTVPAEFADWSAAAENAAQQLNKAGFKITMRGVQFQQHPVDVNSGKFEMAIRAWGAGNPHPNYSYVQDLFVHNYVQSTVGKGMNLQMKQTVDGKEVDLQKLVVDSADGLDEKAQKANVAAVAAVYNALLPNVPLWERYGNNPALDKRIAGWPADDNPLYRNAVYGDNFVVMMILDGTLKAK